MKPKLKRHAEYVLYMVRCADGTYYTGSTNDLEARVKLHNAGNGAKYLRGKGPVRLVYVKGYRYYKRALQGEARLKKLTRSEKQAIIQRYRNAGPTDFSPHRFLRLRLRNLTVGVEIKDVGPPKSLEV